MQLKLRSHKFALLTVPTTRKLRVRVKKKKKKKLEKKSVSVCILVTYLYVRVSLEDTSRVRSSGEVT